ncbi:MAG: class A beta-lactamase-related serine hydrolase [Pyrinomonadaceae bacterium]|nr:class A beta-lactamase-related serine hydrolase [Pyrinomonadaceae bacterium]
MKNLLLILILSLMAVLTASAQQIKMSPFEQRANDLISVLNDPKDLDKVFAPDFLAQVPPAQVVEISKKLLADFGKAVKIAKLTPKSEFSGTISVLFEKNIIAQMNLNVEEKPPHLINGLLITATEKTSASLEEIVGEMKKLPGTTALTVAKLNGKDMQPLVSHNADKPLAIGSTFKLYILSELVRSIAAGERKWSDVVELNESSLPSGMMQDWGKGSSVTLNTLASMMISISDNTATDQLLTTLGREKVERMMTTAGNSNPALSLPFLKTVEMFKLKGSAKQKLAEVYLAKDVAGKRAMLANEIAAFKKEDINFADFLVKPTYISQLEWFATTDDLARLMNWLRMNTEKSPTDKARDVLTINKALSADEAKNWNYIGYKGGSETGVISLTYLLQSKKSEWFVVSGSWNDEKSRVNDLEFVNLMQKTVMLLREKTP